MAPVFRTEEGWPLQYGDFWTVKWWLKVSPPWKRNKHKYGR